MNIHSLSNTRAISRSTVPRESRFPLFLGSSLTRKIYDKKSSQEAEASLCQVDANGQLSQEVDLLCNGSAGGLFQPDGRREAIRRLRSRRDYAHRLSSRSKTKIKEKMSSLWHVGSGTFVFMTLTFINNVTDIKGAEILNKFLSEIRRRYGKFLYIWVAERQDNGNIHFHLVMNQRLPIRTLNGLWVMQQYRAGIVHDNYDMHDMNFLYKSGLIQKALNPVDVIKVGDIDGLSGYMTAYVTKNQGEFTCSAWHCCRGVSALFTGMIVGEKVIQEAKDETINRVLTRKGYIYAGKTYIVKNKETGIEVAAVTNIVNKQYFKKYLYQMIGFNKMIVSGGITKSDALNKLVLNEDSFFVFNYQRE